MFRSSTLSILITLGAVSSCAKPASTGEARSPQVSSGASVPWSKKTRAERMEFMGSTVYPTMKAVFQRADAKAYREFRCQTCHGENMEAVDFKMPNSLIALPADDPVKGGLSYDEATAKFMIDAVVPKMKDMLGKNDPATAQGFGCLNCHQKE